MELKNKIGGAWCFIGDFNVVRKESKRYEGLSGSKEMLEFNDFISLVEVLDLPLLGKDRKSVV